MDLDCHSICWFVRLHTAFIDDLSAFCTYFFTITCLYLHKGKAHINKQPMNFKYKTLEPTNSASFFQSKLWCALKKKIQGIQW